MISYNLKSNYTNIPISWIAFISLEQVEKDGIEDFIVRISKKFVLYSMEIFGIML